MVSRKGVSGALAAAMAVAFTFGLSGLAAAQMRQAPKPAQVNVPPQRLNLTTDLAVQKIEAFDCFCEDNLVKADAMMLGFYRVQVQNLGSVAVDASVKVEYFNMKTNSMASSVQTIHLNKTGYGGSSSAPMFNLPYTLVRRSRPVKATITITSAHVTDSNAGNNTKQTVITSCPYLVK